MTRDELRIHHMIDACNQATEMLSHIKRDDLNTDSMLLLAVVKALEIVGEATERISADTKQLEPSIPWRELAGIRHRLVHEYEKIDRDIVWRAAKDDVPGLVAQLERLPARIEASVVYFSSLLPRASAILPVRTSSLIP